MCDQFTCNNCRERFAITQAYGGEIPCVIKDTGEEIFPAEHVNEVIPYFCPFCGVKISHSRKFTLVVEK